MSTSTTLAAHCCHRTQSVVHCTTHYTLHTTRQAKRVWRVFIANRVEKRVLLSSKSRNREAHGSILTNNGICGCECVGSVGGSVFNVQCAVNECVCVAFWPDWVGRVEWSTSRWWWWWWWWWVEQHQQEEKNGWHKRKGKGKNKERRGTN